MVHINYSPNPQSGELPLLSCFPSGTLRSFEFGINSFRSFNFFGLSVTRNVSATSRSIIDTLRTLFVWLVSLGLGWERFNWLQVLGTFHLGDMILLINRVCNFGVGNVCKFARGLNH